MFNPKPEKRPYGRRALLASRKWHGDGLAMNRVLFVFGLVICGIAAGLLLMGAIESSVAALIGVVGIGLIGSSAVIFTPNGSLKEKKGA